METKEVDAKLMRLVETAADCAASDDGSEKSFVLAELICKLAYRTLLGIG